MATSLRGAHEKGSKMNGVLLTIFLDTSPSMRKRGLLKPAVEGVNQLITALKSGRNLAVSEVSVVGLARSPLAEFRPLAELTQVSEADFPERDEQGNLITGSPIADVLGEILEEMEKYYLELTSQDGFDPDTVRFSLAVVTDGIDAVRANDNRIVRASRKYSDRDIETRLVRFMKGKNRANVIAIGDGDAGVQAVAAGICYGFRQHQVIRAGASDHSIRVAFDELTTRNLSGVR